MNDILFTCDRMLTQNPNLNNFHMHTHDFYEIYCFISGNAKYLVEGNIYKMNHGDILFIKKAEAHSLQITSPSPYERTVINFNACAVTDKGTREILSSFDRLPLGKGTCFPFSMFKEKHWMYYIDKINSSESSDAKRLYLSVLINELYECCTDVLNLRAEQDSFSDIITYLNDHITEALTLDSICECFYISKSQLNRKFKRMTGSTVWEYITAKRLLMARELLQHGEVPTKVYLKCGFNDYSSFYRAYKAKFSESPRHDISKHSSLS